MSISISIELTSIANRASRVPFSNFYQAVGPDGRRFDNRSLPTLRALLKRRYGRDLEITIVDHRSADHRRFITTGA